MLIVLNTQEAKEWSEKNIYEADSLMDPLAVAVKRNLLMPVNDSYFVVVNTEYNGVTWVMDRVWRLTDKEMKEQDLYCRYRYEEHATDYPVGYRGSKVTKAGFNIDERRAHLS